MMYDQPPPEHDKVIVNNTCQACEYNLNCKDCPVADMVTMKHMQYLPPDIPEDQINNPKENDYGQERQHVPGEHSGESSCLA